MNERQEEYRQNITLVHASAVQLLKAVGVFRKMAGTETYIPPREKKDDVTLQDK